MTTSTLTPTAAAAPATSATRIHLEPLPTPFAPVDGPMCVATPSCCCCCCCIATVAGATTHMAAEAYYRAVEEGGSRWGAAGFGIAAGVFWVTMLVVFIHLNESSDLHARKSADLALAVGYIGATVLVALALFVARARRPTAWRLALTPLVAVPLFVLEAIFMAYTRFALLLFALAVPFWLARASRERHEERMWRSGRLDGDGAARAIGTQEGGRDPAPEIDAEASGDEP